MSFLFDKVHKTIHEIGSDLKDKLSNKDDQPQGQQSQQQGGYSGQGQPSPQPGQEYHSQHRFLRSEELRRLIILSGLSLSRLNELANPSGSWTGGSLPSCIFVDLQPSFNNTVSTVCSKLLLNAVSR